MRERYFPDKDGDWNSLPLLKGPGRFGAGANGEISMVEILTPWSFGGAIGRLNADRWKRCWPTACS